MSELKDICKEIEREIKRTESRALHAAVRALNETAFRARNDLIENYQHVFNVRNRSLPKKVTVVKAKKENLRASVGFPFDWMLLNTTGGTKRPEVKKNLSVPVKFGKKETRLASGKIKQSFRPANLLKYGDTHKKRKKGKVANPHAVKIRTKNGKELIARRNKADRKKMDWLYVQTPTGNVKKRWWFTEIVQHAVSEHLKKEFEKSMKWLSEHPKK